MKYLIISVVLLAGCQDAYRYKCQDPANWQKQECNPPTCKANETCTKYLIEVQNEN